MTDDSDVDRTSNPRSENEPWASSRRPESESDDVARPSDDGEQFTREDWEAVPSDPDAGADLGYDLCDWERIDTKDGSEQVMFLPDDEEALKDEAFVVATRDCLASLGENC